MNEPGSGKATLVQVAELWIAASSLALALLRTVFDVLEVMGRWAAASGGRSRWVRDSRVDVDQFHYCN